MVVACTRVVAVAVARNSLAMREMPVEQQWEITSWQSEGQRVEERLCPWIRWGGKALSCTPAGGNVNWQQPSRKAICRMEQIKDCALVLWDHTLEYKSQRNPHAGAKGIDKRTFITSVLFLRAGIWRQPTCPSQGGMNEWNRWDSNSTCLTRLWWGLDDFM